MNFSKEQNNLVAYYSMNNKDYKLELIYNDVSYLNISVKSAYKYVITEINSYKIVNLQIYPLDFFNYYFKNKDNFVVYFVEDLNQSKLQLTINSIKLKNIAKWINTINSYFNYNNFKITLLSTHSYNNNLIEEIKNFI
jgi:hypothetical protein